MIVRNDVVTVADCLKMNPKGVVVSPGPNWPKHAGISKDLIKALPATTPFLGVCLGHQCLVEVFGGETARAQRPLHGEAGRMRHSRSGIMEGIPSPTWVGRYHSLISKLPKSSPLRAMGWSEEEEVMAVRHIERPWFGVQFHPESVLTPCGRRLISNFISMTNW